MVNDGKILKNQERKAETHHGISLRQAANPLAVSLSGIRVVTATWILFIFLICGII
jgi:hypothetical protein